MKYDYQLAVIGAGSAGLSALELAHNLGLKKIVLIEAKKELGGECLNSGCVPSKAMLHAAKTRPEDAWKHINRSISKIADRSDNDEHVRSMGFEVLHGTAEFVDAHTLRVGDTNVTAKYILIATGSKPSVPPIEGIESVDYHTNETIFALNETPKSLTIIGGGPIGCELATAFGLLGTKVTLVQQADRLLPREDAEASTLVLKSLEDLGVHVVLNAQTARVKSVDSGTQVDIAVDGKAQSVTSDQLLIAAGRTPAIDTLKLDNAGVRYNQAGIQIKPNFRTSRAHIYAVGDCIPKPKFTHLAGHQASIALTNMLLPIGSKSGAYLDVVPWITFTEPQIGRIGANKHELDPKKYTEYRMDLTEIDRAVTDEDAGYVSILVDRTGKILGATVVSRSAGELLAPIAHCYYHGQSFASLARTVFPYPTLASGLNLLAGKYAADQARNSRLFGLVTRDW